MSVVLDRDAFKLIGKCDKCGAPLYCIEIESGTAECSNQDCGVTERFNPDRFKEGELWQ